MYLKMIDITSAASGHDIQRRLGTFSPPLRKQLVFICTTLVYAVGLYQMYPVFNKWVAFFAFRLNQHSSELVFSSFCYVLILALIGSMVKDGIFAIFSTGLLFTTFVPLMVIMPYFNPDMADEGLREIAIVSFLIFCSFGMIAPKRRYFGLQISIKTNDIRLILVTICVINTLFIALIFRSVISLESFLDIYGQRAKYREVAGLGAYFLHWQMLVFSPITIFHGVKSRNLMLVIIGALGSITVFAISAMKVALGVPILLWLATQFPHVFGQISSKNFTALFLTALLFGVFFIDSLLESPALSFFVIDRNLYAHGIINMMIFEDFSKMESGMWSGSFLKMFVEQVYLEDPFIMVGQSFFGTDMRANTNFFGDGYINLKFPGILLMSAMSGLTIYITMLILNRHDKALRVLMLPVVVAFMNGPIQVTLLTNGLLLFWLVLLFLPHSAEKKE